MTLPDRDAETNVLYPSLTYVALAAVGRLPLQPGTWPPCKGWRSTAHQQLTPLPQLSTLMARVLEPTIARDATGLRTGIQLYHSSHGLPHPKHRPSTSPA